jgi:ABC-type polar amino acid transport system ATPase subunit
MIVVRGLTKKFDGHAVLDGISLEVRQGEVSVIVGPSGAGKSTFLRCLNGLETFDAGSFSVGDLTVDGRMTPEARNRQLALVRRRVGMVFQQFNLFPHRTVLGNVIEAPMRVLGRSREEATAAARALLERVGMADKLDRWPDTLSGGQQQRVAIARALAMGPEVMLFDEPTSALDPRMAAEVESVISDLARSGQTMVVVTHSVRLARRTAHTIHIFDTGRVVAAGEPSQILKSPDDSGREDL